MLVVNTNEIAITTYSMTNNYHIFPPKISRLHYDYDCIYISQFLYEYNQIRFTIPYVAVDTDARDGDRQGSLRP